MGQKKTLAKRRQEASAALHNKIGTLAHSSSVNTSSIPAPKPIIQSGSGKTSTPKIDYRVSLGYEGWYYDTQLNNEMQSISLHANQKFTPSSSVMDETGLFKHNDESSYDDWSDWTDEPCDEDVYSRNFDGKEKGCGYRIEPICRSLFYEDFIVSAANTWSDLGGDVVGGIWDTMRSTAPFSDFLAGAFNEMANTFDSRGYVSKFSDAFSKLLHVASDSERKMSIYQNKSLVVTGTQMALFGGTGIDFSNLGLRLTLFPEIRTDGKGGYYYKTVTEQVEDLYPYLIGIYKPDVTLGKLIEQEAKDILDKDIKAYDISAYLGWNNPPGGYRANNHLLDSIHQGTLKLRIGGQYSIPNLVCQSATFSFSKQMVKLPKVSINSTNMTTDMILETSPLYCDLNIVLRPMSRYTNRILNEYIASKKGGNTTGRKLELDNKINNSLQNLKKKEQNRRK